MDVEFEDEMLRQLEQDNSFTAGFDVAIVKAFRKRMQLIRAARDERDFRELKSLHYEKLKGDLKGRSSMRLNDQWRLLMRIAENDVGKRVVVISIVDYH